MIKDLNHLSLVNECLKGKQLAFKTLYDSFKGYVYTICIRYGVSEIEIKDQMQIIFMEIFKSLESYNPKKSKFKTWLSRIVINQILIQKRKKKIQFSEIDNKAFNVMLDNSDLRAEALLDDESIKKILSRMPEKYIVAFNMFIIDGYNHKDIAEQLNIPEATSRTLVHRGRSWAMKKLNKKLGLGKDLSYKNAQK